MNQPAHSTVQPRFARAATAAIQAALGLLLGFGTAASVHAQGILASGTITSSGTGPYTYNLTFSDAAGATSSIGSIWYAWVPGSFYLPGTPTGASAPTGWSATVANGSGGSSVQFVASTGYSIAPGQSLSGFSYTATFTPAQLAAAPNSGVSVAYAGGLFVNPNDTFTVAVPEPSTLALLATVAALGLAARRKARTA